MNKIYDAVTDTIGDVANLNEAQRRLVKMGLIGLSIYAGARYLRNLIGRK